VRVDEMEAAGGLRVRQREARRRDLGQKLENQASVARFQACGVKRQCRKMARGGSDPRPGDLETRVVSEVVWGMGQVLLTW
jgi:hypothetical protein